MRINGTEQNFSEKKLYVMIVIFRALCHTDNSNEGRCALLSQDSDGRSRRKTQPCLAAACWSTHNILTGATQGLGQIANSTCAPGQIFSTLCVLLLLAIVGRNSLFKSNQFGRDLCELQTFLCLQPWTAPEEQKGEVCAWTCKNELQTHCWASDLHMGFLTARF